MGGRRRAPPGSNEDFTFVSPVVKYLLFFFNFVFWVISVILVAVGVYARVVKHTEAALACLTVDPAMMIMVVGILMFLITFCGCVGSLRENICLLQTFCITLTVILIIQMAAGILGFIFSDKARTKVTEMINNAIVHYEMIVISKTLSTMGRLSLDAVVVRCTKDWSQNIYFNCSQSNPSKERCSVPFSCCIPSGNKTVINTMCGQGMQDVDQQEAGKQIHTDGCIDKLVDWIHSNLFMLGGIALGLAVPQLFGMVLSQLLINQIKEQIELQNYNLKHRSDPWS